MAATGLRVNGATASALDVTGPMPASFKISSFPAPATTSITPTLRTVTLDELRQLLGTHERRRNKDGRGWSGATYRPGTTRAKKNVVAWSVGAGDFDHQTPDEYMEMRARLVGFGLALFAYSTYQSTESDFRYRLAIPFTPAGDPFYEARTEGPLHRRLAPNGCAPLRRQERPEHEGRQPNALSPGRS
jgi:hypothetical protein